jgi:hypothetical protein
MGKSVRDYMALGLPLDSIIPNCAGSVEPFLNVSRLQNLSTLMGLMSPNPCEAVSLQLHPHGQFVSFGKVGPRLEFIHLLGNTQKCLHMVAHLMGYDIGLGKIP